MKKYTLLALLVVGVSGCSSVNHIGKIGDTDIYRVTTRGFFSPSSTTVVTKPGSNLEVLSAAHGPGVLPAVATAGGIAGGAALLRPARTSVDNSTDTSNVNETTYGPFQKIPPGHINNPGHSK